MTKLYVIFFHTLILSFIRFMNLFQIMNPLCVTYVHHKDKRKCMRKIKRKRLKIQTQARQRALFSVWHELLKKKISNKKMKCRENSPETERQMCSLSMLCSVQLNQMKTDGSDYTESPSIRGADSNIESPSIRGADSNNESPRSCGADSNKESSSSCGADSNIESPRFRGADSNIEFPSSCGANSNIESATNCGADSIIDSTSSYGADSNIDSTSNCGADRNIDYPSSCGADSNIESTSSSICIKCTDNGVTEACKDVCTIVERNANYNNNKVILRTYFNVVLLIFMQY